MYQAKDFSYLLGLEGFSDTLLSNHFKLYEGYVKNTNTTWEFMQGKEGSYEFGEVRRRFGWEWSGMRLHELYFGNMTKVQSAPSDSLKTAIETNFNSWDAFVANFLATGAMRGIGWVMLYQDKESGKLFNVWIDEHALGHLPGATPLLVMDVFEHAYITDYQLDRKSYMDAFWKAVDWQAVEKRMS